MTLGARSAQVWNITGRRNEHTFAVSSTADFTTEFHANAPAGFGLADRIIYCYDKISERVWYTMVPNVREVLGAPFLYQAQRKFASQILAVPVESLNRRSKRGSKRSTSAASLVFSIGRCGSTLLSALLRAAGRTPISEPDSLTQIQTFSARERSMMGIPAINAIIRETAASFAVHCGPRPVLKLRHHCTYIWQELTSAIEHARVVFMMRNYRAWARSRHRAFGDGAEILVKLLCNTIQVIDQMTRSGIAVQVVWYEDLIIDPVGIIRSLDIEADGLGALDANAIRTALGGDSQEGTAIARSSIGPRASEAACLAHFDISWAKMAPTELISANRLERLWDTDAP